MFRFKFSFDIGKKKVSIVQKWKTKNIPTVKVESSVTT